MLISKHFAKLTLWFLVSVYASAYVYAVDLAVNLEDISPDKLAPLTPMVIEGPEAVGPSCAVAWPCATGQSQAGRFEEQYDTPESLASSSERAEELKNLLQTWSDKSTEIRNEITNNGEYNGVKLVNSEARTNLLEALTRNSNYVHSMKHNINNVHSYKGYYFQTNYVDDNGESRPLTVMEVVNDPDPSEDYALRYAVSDPDNLFKTYTNTPGGIKRAGANSNIHALKHIKERLGGKIVRAEAASEIEEDILRRLGFTEDKLGCR